MNGFAINRMEPKIDTSCVCLTLHLTFVLLIF